MPYAFEIVDVFTDRPFAGNQLAVVTDARGLTPAQMQAIAREFNFAETSFVLPPADPANSAQVRIFTPEYEMPFAGHPNVGTAYVLGRMPGFTDETLRFEEAAGLVEITLRKSEGRVTGAHVKAPRALEIGRSVSPEVVAELAGLAVADIVTSNMAPCFASVGASFLIAEVTAEALERASGQLAAFQQHFSLDDPNSGVGLHIHAPLPAEADGVLAYDVRMFCPHGGLPEDPATGSAAASFGALMRHLDPVRERFVLRQGRHIGRPSVIHVQASADAVWIGGDCAFFARGEFSL